jgi:hypothetical protein
VKKEIRYGKDHYLSVRLIPRCSIRKGFIVEAFLQTYGYCAVLIGTFFGSGNRTTNPMIFLMFTLKRNLFTAAQ